MRNAYTRPLAFAGHQSVGALALWYALSMLCAGPARAAEYPDRPVRIIVPFAAGGTADAVPRLVGDWLSRKWGQPVVIENRTGAGGNIGADAAYHSAPDGYTLLSSPPPPLVINQNLYPNLGFDPAKFEPIIVMAHVPNALLINPKKLKASSVPELIEYLRKNPDNHSVAEMRTQLELEYAHASEPDTMRRMAKEFAERTMIIRVGRAVVYALAKQLNQEWTTEDMARAQSPESLSIAADDFIDGLQNVRRRMGIALRAARQDAPEPA